MTDDALLDKNEAKKLLGNIGTTKLYQLLNAGLIKAVKVGKCLKFRRSEIIRFISELPEYKTETSSM
jgi:hypothetical protein